MISAVISLTPLVRDYLFIYEVLSFVVGLQVSKSVLQSCLCPEVEKKNNWPIVDWEGIDVLK